ncbi:hypothetical protein PDIDSM_2957 [Penicillium digitatum]|nr:hypothetical protein PDIDSM_2957 [Penicillium digitatum]
MTGRYEGRPERQNEYFIPGEGISREVIQADICRYLGNDALVRPGNHNGPPGFFIRAYRNLTSEMITDLKADSTRWEADVSRRADLGYPRGNYLQDTNVPNTASANYAPAAVHEVRQSQGPSPTPFTAAPAQSYMDPYSQGSYSGSRTSLHKSSTIHIRHSLAICIRYSSVPSTPGFLLWFQSTRRDGCGHATPQSYTYAPRAMVTTMAEAMLPIPGPGYDAEQEYSNVTSGMSYPTTSAPDPRIGMEPRYTQSMSAGHKQPETTPTVGGKEDDRPRVSLHP